MLLQAELHNVGGRHWWWG